MSDKVSPVKLSSKPYCRVPVSWRAPIDSSASDASQFGAHLSVFTMWLAVLHYIELDAKKFSYAEFKASETSNWKDSI